MDDLNPVWEEQVLTVSRFCDGDVNAEIKINCVSYTRGIHCVCVCGVGVRAVACEMRSRLGVGWE